MAHFSTSAMPVFLNRQKVTCEVQWIGIPTVPEPLATTSQTHNRPSRGSLDYPL
jgi:hypothetical protein